MLVPASLALVLPEFPLEKRATATALWGATGAVAAATGPALGGLLVGWQSWRWVFFVNLLIGLPALIPARRILRESREPGASLPDALGAVLLAVGVGALALGIVQGPDWGWSSGARDRRVRRQRRLARAVPRALEPSPGPGDRALAVQGALVRGRERGWVRVRARLLRAPALQRALPHRRLGLLDRQGRGRGHARAADGGALRADRRPALGPLRAARRRRPGGLVFAAGALLFATTLDASSAYATEFLPATILTGIGVGLSFASFGSAAVAELPRDRFATGGAINNTFRQIGRRSESPR